MLNWLVQDFRVLGLTGQNWMPLVGGLLLLYVVIALLVRQRQPH